MNWDKIQGDWKQFKGRAKQRWGKLSNEDLEVLAGRRDVLAGKIIEAYAISKEQAEQQLSDWQHSLAESDAAGSAARAPAARH